MQSSCRPVDNDGCSFDDRQPLLQRAAPEQQQRHRHGLIVIDVAEMSIEQLETVQTQLHSIIVERRKRERSGQPQHRQRASKRQKTQENTTECYPAISIPSEVLRLIARSGFLRSQELGKLLLFSNKTISKTLTPSFIYKLLYDTRMKDRWASPTGRERNEWVPPCILQARSHEIVLKSLANPPDIKINVMAFSPLPNPKPSLHPQNTVVILSFWILSQKVYSHQLTQEEVKSLTKNGHCDFSSQNSLFEVINLCFQKDNKFPQKLREIQRKSRRGATSNTASSTKDVDPGLVVAKLHGIRMDTNQILTLYDSTHPRFEFQRTHSEHNQQTVKFPIQRALRNTDQGDHWIAQWFHNGWLEGIQNFGGLTFSVTLKRDAIHIESIVFGEPGRSEYLQTRHGISPFQIIEGLAGWR